MSKSEGSIFVISRALRTSRQHGVTVRYLARELRCVSDVDSRRRLRSWTFHQRVASISVTAFFGVAAARVYTVSHKKGANLFLSITLSKINGF